MTVLLGFLRVSQALSMGWQQDTPLGVTALFLSAATVATLALYNRKYKVSMLLEAAVIVGCV